MLICKLLLCFTIEGDAATLGATQFELFNVRDDVCDQRIVLSLPCAPKMCSFFGAVFRGSEQ